MQNIYGVEDMNLENILFIQKFGIIKAIINNLIIETILAFKIPKILLISKINLK
jgi:hypothetical protein